MSGRPGQDGVRQDGSLIVDGLGDPATRRTDGAAHISMPSGGTLTWRVRALAVGYFTLFLAYSGTQLLQSTINGSAGFWCLGVLYALFAVSALVAPWVVARTPSYVIIPASASLYVVMVAANIQVHPVPLVLSCAGVGFAASTLWSAQGVFIGKCANGYAAATRTPLTVATSQLNASFYTIFASAGAFSAAFSSILLLSMRNAIGPLFVVLTIVGMAAVVWLMCVADAADASAAVMRPQALLAAWQWLRNGCAPGAQARGGTTSGDASLVRNTARANVTTGSIDDAEAWDMRPVDGHASHMGDGSDVAVKPPREPAQPHPAPSPTVGIPSLGYMVSFLAQRRLMRLMLPILVVSGLSNGVFNGVWFASLVRPLVGLDYVGFVGASYAAASSISTRIFGQLTKRPTFGRRWAMAVAAVLQALFLCGSTLAYATFWTDGEPSAWLMTIPHGGRVAILCLAAGLYGVGDAVWFSQLPATLQTFYPTGKDAPCAMASIRFYFSIGFAMSSLLSLLLASAVATQLMFQCVCLGVAVACLWYMHRYVQNIDASMPSPPADDAVAGGGDSKSGDDAGKRHGVALSVMARDADDRSLHVQGAAAAAVVTGAVDCGGVIASSRDSDAAVRKRSTSRGEA